MRLCGERNLPWHKTPWHLTLLLLFGLVFYSLTNFAEHFSHPKTPVACRRKFCPPGDRLYRDFVLYRSRRGSREKRLTEFVRNNTTTQTSHISIKYRSRYFEILTMCRRTDCNTVRYYVPRGTKGRAGIFLAPIYPHYLSVCPGTVSCLLVLYWRARARDRDT